MEKGSTNRLGRKKLKESCQRTVWPQGTISENSLIHALTLLLWQVFKKPHNLFCTQGPRPREKTSDWTSLGLVATQKERGKCFNRAPVLHNGECPKIKMKLGEILVKGKTNVHNSPNRTTMERTTSLFTERTWRLRELKYLQQRIHLRPGLHHLFSLLLFYGLSLNYTWSFKIIQSNLKTRVFATNRDI